MNELFCFVPSWYTDGEAHCAYPVPWQRRGIRMEFDDTVNQIKMFQKAGEEVMLLLPFYMPELRRFLHREGIADVRIYSVFDILQGIQDQTPGMLSFHSLGWPQDLEWVYTPFIAEAYRDDRLFVRVHFGEGGHMIRFELFRDGSMYERTYADDRGFLSCTEKFAGDRMVMRTFYNPERHWVMREDTVSGAVRLNPGTVSGCERTEYEDLDTLIREMLHRYISHLEKDAVLITASDQRHNQKLLEAAAGRKTVLSVFSQRNAAEEYESIAAAGTELIVTDTEYAAAALRNLCKDREKTVLNLSPYDARVAMGQSQRIRELKIFCHIGRIDAEVRAAWLGTLLAYVNSHKNTEIILGIGRESGRNVSRNALQSEVSMLSRVCGFEGIHPENIEKISGENDPEQKVRSNVLIRECASETEILEQLADARIIVDLQREPDLYLQIAGLSAGLPMLIRESSQYAEHGRNGWLLEEPQNLTEALDYYLKGLENWNRSLVHSVKKISGYTNGAIVREWRNLLGLSVREADTDGRDN